jgi:hypothetical protein
VAQSAAAARVETPILYVAQGVFTPVDQAKQLATWTAIHQIGAAWSEFLRAHPVILSRVCCEWAWPIGDDVPRTVFTPIEPRGGASM